MGQDPSAIREEIERTRQQMGDTVEALGYKTDVGARARDRIDSIKSKVTGAPGRVADAAPDPSDVAEGARHGAQRAAGMAQQNPIGLGLVGLAAGMLVGSLLPATSVEQERIGPIADDFKDKAKETGQEALERGKTVAQEAASAAQEAAQDAAESVQEAGREQADELRSSAQEKAQEIGQTDTPPSGQPSQSQTGGAGAPRSGMPGSF